MIYIWLRRIKKKKKGASSKKRKEAIRKNKEEEKKKKIETIESNYTNDAMFTSGRKIEEYRRSLIELLHIRRDVCIKN